MKSKFSNNEMLISKIISTLNNVSENTSLKYNVLSIYALENNHDSFDIYVYGTVDGYVHVFQNSLNIELLLNKSYFNDMPLNINFNDSDLEVHKSMYLPIFTEESKASLNN